MGGGSLDFAPWWCALPAQLWQQKRLYSQARVCIPYGRENVSPHHAHCFVCTGPVDLGRPVLFALVANAAHRRQQYFLVAQLTVAWFGRRSMVSPHQAQGLVSVMLQVAILQVSDMRLSVRWAAGCACAARHRRSRTVRSGRHWGMSPHRRGKSFRWAQHGFARCPPTRQCHPRGLPEFRERTGCRILGGLVGVPLAHCRRVAQRLC